MLSLSPSLEHISSGCPQGLKCTRCASFPGKCKWIAPGRGEPPRTARFGNLCSAHGAINRDDEVFLSSRQTPVVWACVNKVKKLLITIHEDAKNRKEFYITFNLINVCRIAYARNENSLWKTFLFLLCHIIRLIVLGQWKLQRPFLESYNMSASYVLSIVSRIYDATVNARQVSEMRMKMPETSMRAIFYTNDSLCEILEVYLNCSPSVKDISRTLPFVLADGLRLSRTSVNPRPICKSILYLSIRLAFRTSALWPTKRRIGQFCLGIKNNLQLSLSLYYARGVLAIKFANALIARSICHRQPRQRSSAMTSFVPTDIHRSAARTSLGWSLTRYVSSRSS